MSELSGVVDKQIGPLPFAAWAAIAVAGVGAGLYFRKHFGASSTDTTTTPEFTSQGGTNVDTAGNLSGGSYQGTATGGTVAGGISQSINTNDDWRSAVERILIGKGYDAATVDSAVTKYLTGIGLSQQEYNIVDQAIISGGPTPQATAPPTIVAAPIPANDPAPAVATPVVTPTPAPAPVPAAPAPVAAPAPPAPPAPVDYSGNWWWGKQVDWNDASVPIWYKMGFTNPDAYNAIYSH